MSRRLPEPSSLLAPHIRAFLDHKRALNRKYDVEDKALRLFDRYLKGVGVGTLDGITPEILDAFFLGRPRDRPQSFNHLVGVVGRLFEWMVEHDIIDRSPVTTRLRRPGRTRPPFIFDLSAAQRLVDVAASLKDNNKGKLRGPTYAMIFSLLFGLGLRPGEAARLRRRDFDSTRSILTIRETKFSKTRLLPMGPQLASRLAAFLAKRTEQADGLSEDDPIFSFTGGRPINPSTISQTFHLLVPMLGLTVPEGTRSPTAHHLRHSFAVGRLLRWYREDRAPAANLLKLSTFMGHVDPTSTAVYLTIAAELLEAGAQRFERFAAPLSCGGRP
jgi:integrase